MASLNELREERIKKLKIIEKSGMNPYPSSTRREIRISDLLNNIDSYLEASTDHVWVAGRIMAVRVHGKSIFFDMYDGSESIQVYLKEDILGEDAFKLFEDAIDIGDFVEVQGTAFTTKQGEESIKAKEWNILSKSLRPLPEKWHGLKDEEEKFRKRYLDILFNPEVREMVERKARFWRSIREFLVSRGFLEVQTPVLETTTGGADARPFVTFHHAHDMEVYLRISAGELWQKELLVGGFEKVFEIGRIFRNEGISSEHLQDYTQMEFYMAYADYRDGMKLVEELYKHIAKETFGTLQFIIGDFEVDLGGEWETYNYAKVIKKETGVNISDIKPDELEKKLKELKILYEPEGFNRVRGIDALWKYCRAKIGGPGFLLGIPYEMSPLAKTDPSNENIVEQFQPIIGGSEVGKGYSELNDPLDQANRFEMQASLRREGDEEAQMYAREFVEALEYGMPPACGFGLSERLFSFLSNKPIRETQIFPLLKPKD